MNTQETLVAIYRTASDREITFLAAAVAYYAFVSLIPLVLLALVVGSFLGGEAVAERLITFTGELLPPAGETLLTEALTTESGRVQATVVSFAVSTWGALKVVRGLSLAFDRVYDAPGTESLVDDVRDGIVVLVAVAGAIVVMFGLGVVIRLAADWVPFAGVVTWVVLLASLTLAFIPVYYVLPPVDVDLVDILPGAAFAAVGWTALQVGFQLYAANAAQYEAYGAVGAVILFVTWLYVAGISILLGAVLNVVRSDRVE